MDLIQHRPLCFPISLFFDAKERSTETPLWTPEVVYSFFRVMTFFTSIELLLHLCLTDVGEQMGLSVECSMVVFFSCLLFSKLRPARDCKLEAALASAASQKERGIPFFLFYVVSNSLSFYGEFQITDGKGQLAYFIVVCKK